MNVQELIERYNAEQVGSRLIAIVDGRKEYIADVGSGGFQLTAAGLKLQHEHEVAKEEAVEEKAPAPKPKKTKVKQETVEPKKTEVKQEPVEPEAKPTELEASLNADLGDIDDLLGE